MTEGYTTTADYEHINVALKSFWKPFNELAAGMESFVPRPLSDFDDKRRRLSENIQQLNPNMSKKEVIEYVEKQIASSESPQWQYVSLFSERFMTMYVTITLLSHALCEAEINTILATGLFENGTPELFAILQKADIKEKWQRCTCSQALSFSIL